MRATVALALVCAVSAPAVVLAGTPRSTYEALLTTAPPRNKSIAGYYFSGSQVAEPSAIAKKFKAIGTVRLDFNNADHVVRFTVFPSDALARKAWNAAPGQVRVRSGVPRPADMTNGTAKIKGDDGKVRSYGYTSVAFLSGAVVTQALTTRLGEPSGDLAGAIGLAKWAASWLAKRRG